MKNAYKKNKLVQLRGFCAVIEEGSVLKASKKLNIAQSNVSLQILCLERDLQTTLFKREKQRITPLPEALRFYKVAKKSIEDIDMIYENTMKTIKEDYENIIKISAHSYMLSHILPPYFKKMIEENPKVKFELHNSSYTEAIDMVNNGIVDFAIFPVNKEDLPKNIIVQDFYKCNFTIGMHENHPLVSIEASEITWNVIAKYDYISLGNQVTAQGLKSAMQTVGVNSRFDLRNGTWEICAGIVKEGLAITGGDIMYAKWHNDVITKLCPHLVPSYEFYILQNSKTSISKASKDFINFLTHKS
jgi:DNA-binding transcriptional LysR family regulator